jgi:hypothetical protein
MTNEDIDQRSDDSSRRNGECRKMMEREMDEKRRRG